MLLLVGPEMWSRPNLGTSMFPSALTPHAASAKRNDEARHHLHHCRTMFRKTLCTSFTTALLLQHNYIVQNTITPAGSAIVLSTDDCSTSSAQPRLLNHVCSATSVPRNVGSSTDFAMFGTDSSPIIFRCGESFPVLRLCPYISSF